MANIAEQKWLWVSCNDLQIELQQLEDEGRDAGRLKKRFKALIGLGDKKLALEPNQEKAALLLDEAQKLPMRRGYAYDEPDELAAIRKLRPRGPRKYKKRLSDAAIRDRITGAWLGRCVGCFLGKPLEGVRLGDLYSMLKTSKQFPLRNYVKFGVPMPGATPGAKGRAKNMQRFDKMRYMPIDDDTNYTTTGVLVVKTFGADFEPSDVALFWMRNLPLLATCTAERVAYRNFANRVAPPRSATLRNPYREWIGAQIRADGFAYTVVGDPQRAADFAWRDAYISHVKNGIYGEMFVAAMMAAAPYVDGIHELIDVGLSEIPRSCRLAGDVREIVDLYDSGVDFDGAVKFVHNKWDEKNGHDWCHTNSNAVICCVGLLWGEGDFGRSICRSVQPCLDTDCNGATVGSIVGMMLGAKKLPSRWTSRLNDTLRTAIFGYDTIKISQIAKETFELHKKIR